MSLIDNGRSRWEEAERGISEEFSSVLGSQSYGSRGEYHEGVKAESAN